MSGLSFDEQTLQRGGGSGQRYIDDSRLVELCGKHVVDDLNAAGDLVDGPHRGVCHLHALGWWVHRGRHDSSEACMM